MVVKLCLGFLKRIRIHQKSI